MNKFRRAAILIGCPGPQTNFLKGVNADLRQMHEFLLSANGGSWQSHEVFVLRNAGINEVARHIRSVTADYLFVYFSGHGYTDKRNNKRVICLSDSNIIDLSLVNQSSRQLVIVDSCRNYIGSGIGTPSFQLGDPFDSFDGTHSTRDFFDRCIYQSPHGKLVLHSTLPGKSSIDSPQGGYFTQALLTIGARIKAEGNFVPASIKTVARFVPQLLEKHGVSQYPQIVYSEGDLRVPFALGIPTGVRSGHSMVRSPSKQQMVYNFSPWF